VTIDGVANHGGTTPMDRRFDSLVSASELVLAVNSVALDLPGRQVATVGRIQAYPGAPNVVPGRTVMSLEIRDLDAEKMQFVFEQIEMAAEEIAGRRGTPIRFEEIDTASPPAPTDETMRDVIAGAAEYLGYSFRRMPSGAGHDAQDLAKITPTGMIFVPSRDGISHSPEEYTAPEDMARGASVLFHTIMDIDQRPGR
jgi:N-carbamoyl-L-amino-acid hydrolase